jgi:hypothetical protein
MLVIKIPPHFKARIVKSYIPSPLGDCVITRREGMNEEASAGDEDI